MDTESFTEGLFLKNYLGTVSTVPKSRTPNQADTKCCVNSYFDEDFRRCKNHSIKNSIPDHLKINYYLKEKNVNDLDFCSKDHNGSLAFKTFIGTNATTDLNQLENEKKKEKKWNLGILFRKKCKKNNVDVSDDSEEDIKKNFIIRRKCKKEKRKSKAKSTANGFDMIIPKKKDEIKSNKFEVFDQFSKENESKIIYQKSMESSPKSTNNAPVRFIHRHRNNFSDDEKIKSGKDILQDPNNIQKNSNNFHISGPINESVDGRKCRKKVMARAEAKRDMICDDSSSEEYESLHSNSSLNRNCVNQLGSRKPKRNKRLFRNDSFGPKSEDSSTFKKNDDLNLIESDVPFYSDSKKGVLPYSVDRHDENSSLKIYSKTDSVIRNSQKQQIIGPMESCQTKTFPFVHCLQKSQNLPPSFSNLSEMYKFDRVTPNENHKSQLCLSNSIHENEGFIHEGESSYLSNFPQSFNTTPNSKLCNSDPFFMAKRKDYFSNQEIYRETFNTERLQELQELSLKKYAQNSNNDSVESDFALLDFKNPKEFEIFENIDAKKSDADDYYFNPNNLHTFKNTNRLKENGANITPAFSTQLGNTPNQLMKVILQRSGSEHSFGYSKFSKNFEQNRSNSYQNIPTTIETEAQVKVFSQMPNWNYSKSDIKFSEKPNYFPIENCRQEKPSTLRYYADQNPRSRNPIHITYNLSKEFLLNDPQEGNKFEDGYLSEQATSKASVFWKTNDQQAQKKTTEQGNFQNVYRPPPIQRNLKLNGSTSNALNSPEIKSISCNQSFAHNGNDLYLSQNQFKNYILVSDPKGNYINESESLEPSVVKKLEQHEGPGRMSKDQTDKVNNEIELTNDTSNLGDALNELENIYNCLKFKGENSITTDKAIKSEQKFFLDENLKEFTQKAEKNSDIKPDIISESIPSAKECLNFETVNSPINIPDKVFDDMAFRRMNVKDRNITKKFISPSYLRLSFTSPEIDKENPTLKTKTLKCTKEPDITYDDVVFRNIRHARNTLKVLDPQPPFGIPIGIFTPAPCSNYLHATPKERFRPTFVSRKTPDVVKDDLAFRNLRKDSKQMEKDTFKNDSNLLKKRAVRSLSANISTIMLEKDSAENAVLTNENNVIEKQDEKTQSLTNLANGLNYEKEISEKRLKELKEEKNNEFFKKFSEINSKIERNRKGILNSFKKSEFNNFDEKIFLNVNKNNDLDSKKKSDLEIPPKYSSIPTDKKLIKSSIVALSKYPAATISSLFPENTCTKNIFDFNENKLDNFVTVLDVENAVNDLERQLNSLDSKFISENKVSSKCTTALEEFNKKYKSNSLEKIKRKRNLSLSNMNEFNVDEKWVVKTNSLERRKWPVGKNSNLPQFDDIFESARNYTPLEKPSFQEKELHPTVLSDSISSILSERASEDKTLEFDKVFLTDKPLTGTSSLNSEKLKLNSSLELESDLLKIKENVEIKKHPKKLFVDCESSTGFKDTFQEVYEYNCQFADKKKSKLSNILMGKKSDKLSFPIELRNDEQEQHSLSDVEREFEMLHKEESESTKNAKENEMHQIEFDAVHDYVADISKSVDSSKDSNILLTFRDEGRRSYTDSRTLKLRKSASEMSGKREGHS